MLPDAARNKAVGDIWLLGRAGREKYKWELWEKRALRSDKGRRRGSVTGESKYSRKRDER